MGKAGPKLTDREASYLLSALAAHLAQSPMGNEEAGSELKVNLSALTYMTIFHITHGLL